MNTKLPTPRQIPGKDINVYVGLPLDEALAKYEDSSGSVQDPSTWDLTLHVIRTYRKKPDSHEPDEVDQTYTLSGGGLVIQSNVVHIDWSKDDTDKFAADKRYRYVLEVDDGNNDPYYSHAGRIRVFEQVPQ